MAETVYKAKKPFKQDGKYYYPITTADQIMKSDNSRLEQNGEIVADNSPKLGGIAASEYALKTKTVPTSRTINEKALSENITLSASDVSARPDTWMPSASDVGALPSGGTAVNASKLGGKAPEYYLQPRNLLDNSDFRNPVNQRGATSYTGVEYTIDRWKIWDNSTLNVNDGYIEITERAYQYYPLNTFKNTVHTFAAKKIDGTIVITTFNPNNEPIQDIYGNLLGSDGYTTIIGLARGQYVWAALYEGTYTADTLPPYVPKGYGAELAECRRYFRRYTANNASLILNGLVTSGSKDISVHAPELTPMRTKNVSIVYSGPGVLIRGVSGYATECSNSNTYGNISVSPYQNNSSFCATMDINKKDGTAWGLTNNTPVVVQFVANSILDYIADL